MVEKDFQRIFTGWIKENAPLSSEVYELKMEKGPSIAFDRLADHQVDALVTAKYSGLFHKIADTPVSWMKDTAMRFGKPKPFDCLFVRAEEAYVVILFYKPRKPKEVMFIGVDEWLDERDKSPRKSLTEGRAREISSKIITI